MAKEQLYMSNKWLKKVLHEEPMAKEQCYMRNKWLRNSATLGTDG